MTRKNESKGIPICIYTRLSKDPTGRLESPDNHVWACRPYIEQLGFTVWEGEPFIDRDISGWRDKVRPAFDLMMQGIKNGDFGGVCVVEVSRFSRNLRRAIPWVNQILDAGALILSESEHIDTSDPLGLSSLYGRFAQAETESLKISRRTKLGNEARAAQGRPHHGRRCFGYTTRYEQIPAEVKVARKIVSQLLDGDTLSSIARGLNERGVKTTMDGLWTGSSVRQWASSPTLAGIRRYRTTDERREYKPGTEVKGTWKPIITTEQRQTLLIRLGDVRPDNGGKTITRWLLSGIALCGTCGQRMHVHTGTRRYVCSKVDGKGCGKIAASVDRVDEIVTSKVLDLLADLDVEPVSPSEDGGGDDVEQLERKLRDLNVSRFDAEEITAAEWKPLRDALVARLDAAREARDARSIEIASRLPTGTRDELTAWWDAVAIEERRTAVRGAYSIRILPATKLGCQFDAGRVQLNRNRAIWSRVAETHVGPDLDGNDPALGNDDLDSAPPEVLRDIKADATA
jgi:site-specific DNA recombinase